MHLHLIILCDSNVKRTYRDVVDWLQASQETVNRGWHWTQGRNVVTWQQKQLFNYDKCKFTVNYHSLFMLIHISHQR